MDLYFFRNAPLEFRKTIVEESVKKNLILVRYASYVLLLITGSALLSMLFVDYSHFAQKIPLLYLNAFFLFFALKSLLMGHLLGKNVKNEHVPFARIFCFLFALFVICGGMWVSIIAQNNPRNTMTMYALAAVCISVLWLFEYRETLSMMLICQVIFSVCILFFQKDSMERIMNQFVSLFLLSSCFLVSRWIYSLHVNHFLQLHSIEEKSNQLERLGMAKTEILSVVAHDLRSPLSNIEMLVSMSLNEDLPPEENEEHLRLILASCRSSRTIINDLIEFSRDDDNQFIQTQKVVMQDFLTGIYLDWKKKLVGSRTLLLTQDETSIFAYIHPDKLSRVLDNLISNAIKFTHDGGHIHIDMKVINDQVQITVNDDGVGIPQNLMPYIFDRFSRAGRSGLHGETSIGLGLSITKKIVDQHRGKIKVSNNEKGTTFSVELPIAWE